MKRRKGGASKEYEASLGTIKELRMRLVSAEEESGKLQRQLNALPAGENPPPRCFEPDACKGLPNYPHDVTPESVLRQAVAAAARVRKGTTRLRCELWSWRPPSNKSRRRPPPWRSNSRGARAAAASGPRRKAVGPALSRRCLIVVKLWAAVLTVVVVPVRGYVQLRGWRWRQEAGLACVCPQKRSGKGAG